MDKNNVMRKRDPKHDASLNALIKLNADGVTRLVSIDDYLHLNYVASEVLVSLIRMKYGLQLDVLHTITKVLHKRVIVGIQSCIRHNDTLRALAVSNSELVQEAASYFWEKLLEDTQVVSNSEVRFGVYLKNRVIDYMRHLLTEENTRQSTDAFTSVDEEGKMSNYIDALSGDDDDSPEVMAIRAQDKSILMSVLTHLPQDERHAFYFRVECNYDWAEVAKYLSCSIPTARKLFKSSVEKLQGALK
ncbi:MAG: sigma-70 family RNA polymerase sigma factor [Methylotenera sp.]